MNQATSPAVSLAQAHDLCRRTLAGRNLVEEGGPFLQRAAALIEQVALVVGGGDAALEPGDVTERSLHDPRRNAEFVVCVGREEPAQIVQHKTRHRRLDASGLACGGNALVERCLGPGPAGEALSITEDELTPVLRPRLEDSDGGCR